MFDFFKKVITFHPIQKTLAVQRWNVSELGRQFRLAFITFLYVDIPDTTSTLYSMARSYGAIDERAQGFEGSAITYIADALGISIGSLSGSSLVTACIESGAGTFEGGKIGLAAIFTGIAFFISIFFASILHPSSMGHWMHTHHHWIPDG